MNILNKDFLNNESNKKIFTKEMIVKINYINNLLNNQSYNSFLTKKTTYGIDINDLNNLIVNSNSLSFASILNPFIIDINEFFLNYIKYYIGFPSLIDYDNQIVFLNISHKKLIEQIVSNCFFNENEILKSYEKKEKLFHQKINSSQVFVDSRAYNKNFPLVIINSNKINFLKDYFFNILHINKIKYENNENLDEYFNVLNNVSNIIEGVVYFPKPNEESIPEGKILVIPTASEEYFLPSLSSMNGNGCIITERGSKTSHIVLMSKEFNFNIILIENAIEKFNDGDVLTINLEEETIIFNK